MNVLKICRKLLAISWSRLSRQYSKSISLNQLREGTVAERMDIQDIQINAIWKASTRSPSFVTELIPLHKDDCEVQLPAV